MSAHKIGQLFPTFVSSLDKTSSYLIQETSHVRYGDHFQQLGWFSLTSLLVLLPFCNGRHSSLALVDVADACPQPIY